MMNSSDTMSSPAAISDAVLVAASVAGDRSAFGRIVERYQRLLCSLAYSSTGQLSQSEDLAQDAFVDAWRQIHTLREPEKLRSWLCGILRFKISRLRRADRREPVRQADALDEIAEQVASADTPAADLAIREEEQAIMWSALERVPETYREPLILYYREGCSVENVAEALDLSEDNVRQRLVRGRKVLQEQVLAFVEGALARSTPGRVFTLGVLAALPELATPAKAIGIGAVVTQGGMLVKTTGFAALATTLSGIAGPIFTLRANLDQSRTPRERRAVVKITIAVISGALGFIGLLWLLREGAFRSWDERFLFAAIAQALVLTFAVVWPWGLLCVMRYQRRLRSSERLAFPGLFQDPRHQPRSAAGEYKSRWTLLGVPLVHIRFSIPDADQGPVFGWFAGGDRAFGLIFAWGGAVVAPISVGAICVGFVAIGNLSVGVISVGTVGLGFVAFGCAAIGFKAFAWLSAVGWESAQGGGFCLARIAAEGPIALAQYANDPVARYLLANSQGEQHELLVLSVVTMLSVLPIACYAIAVRRRMGVRAPHKNQAA
jgi:RNA polymerase sigma factor (sigma-70 family)